jgi:hypothetical protein
MKEVEEEAEAKGSLFLAGVRSLHSEMEISVQR